MRHDHAVYILVAIGIALEDATITKVLEKAMGRHGLDKLREAEVEFAKEKNLKPYRR